jgi:hypothetical protein
MQAQEESSSVETQTGDAVSKPKVLINFLHALLAIILGNVVYFALVPSLPPAARHHPFHLDLGTLLDFFFCVVVYGLIRTVRKWR